MALLFLLALFAAATNSYQATVLRVIDGDTIRVSIEIWHEQTVITSIRVRGVDTPELKGKCEEERALARKAREFTSTLLSAGSRITLTKIAPDKYGGRYDADVTIIDGRELAAVLIESGLARPYKGEKRGGWC